MIRRLGILTLLLALAVACAPAAQGAVTASVTSCNDVVADSSAWYESTGTGGGFSLEDLCASGHGLNIENNAAEFEQEAGFAFNLPTDVTVISYSFDIAGGDTSTGVEYGTKGCPDCAVDRMIGDRDDGSPAEHIAVNNPTSDSGPMIFASCQVPAGCGATPHPLRVSNLVVTLSDSVPPDVHGYVTDLPGNPFDPDAILGWTNKSFLPVELAASDFGGFGIAGGSVTADGDSTPVKTWDFLPECADLSTLTYPSACPTDVYAHGFAEIGDLPDGIHDLFFSAIDRAGNTASTSAGRIGVDRMAPARPESAGLAFTPSGWPGQRWTSDPQVTMSWDGAPEILDPDFESPIAAQKLSVRRRESPTILQSSVPLNEQSKELTLLSDGEWDVSVRFDDRAANAGEPATKTVGLDVDAPNAPTNLTADDWYSAADIATRPRLHWDAPTDNPGLESGICGYTVRLDDQTESVPVFGQDDSTIATSWPLPAGLPDGVSYFHVRAVSCAGVASSTETIALHIDTSPPEISVAGLADQGDWSGQQQTALISASDAISGVESVGFAIDDQPVTWTPGNSASVVLPEGAHVLKSYSRDVAGNVRSLETAANTDTIAPSVDIATTSVSDPTLSSARVQDASSGLAGLAIELRRVDQGADLQERQWQAIGGAEPIVRGDTDPVDISRRIDDAQLPAGDYELRVNVRDVAGNSTADGSFAIRALHLPIRRQAELSVAVADILKSCRTASGKRCANASRCSAKSRCRTVEVVDRDNAKSSVVRTWPARSAVVGDALDASGAPLAGVSVAIIATSPFHEPEPLGSVLTDSAGRYELRLEPRPTSTLAARIEGGPIQQPATASATRIVRSELEFAPKPRRLRGGQDVKLQGRVLHDAWLPVGGVPISFQWYSPNGWAAFANPTWSDAQGRFSLTYRWSASARKSSVRLRARIDQPTGWPFAPGSSRSVQIRVLPAR